MSDVLFICGGVIGIFGIACLFILFVYIGVDIIIEEDPMSLRAFLRMYCERLYKVWQWVASSNEPKRKREIDVDKVVPFRGLDPFINTYNAERDEIMEIFQRQEADMMEQYQRKLDEIIARTNGKTGTRG